MSSDAASSATSRRARLLTFRGGGWVLLVAGLLVAGIIVWQLVLIYPSIGQRSPGNGRDVASYGFDLSNLLVPREWLAAGLDAKDGLPAMSNPQFVAASTLAPGAKLGGIDKLTSTDRVIGVEIDGQARAYPLWIMNWHEVVNDSLGETPIAVTYSALCDSVVVFDRRVAAETLEFGVSGLLYNSNLLLYDRRASSPGESLWYQLQFRAIAGPAAAQGKTLNPLPAWLGPWKEWREAHPGTLVLLPDPARKARYRQDPYGAYFSDNKLRFPVIGCAASAASASSSRLKTPLRIAIRPSEAVGLPLSGVDNPPTLGAEPTVYSFAFAWYAATCSRSENAR